MSLKNHHSKGWRYTLYIFAAMGLISFIGIITLGTINYQKRIDYKQRKVYIEQSKNNDSLPTNIVLVSQWKNMNIKEVFYEQIETYFDLIDSLKILDAGNDRGLSFHFDLLPVGKPGYREYNSNMDILLDCGCDNVQGYDLLELKINTRTFEANILSSQEKMTIDYYNSLKKRNYNNQFYN
jgi:hypothetical protein